MLRLGFRALLALGAVLVLLALEVSPALGTSSLGGKLRYGNSITVPVGETVNSDLYVFAGTVTVDGTVHGDLVAFGGTIISNGTVDGDVIAGGGTIDVGGTVGGGVRAGGGQITVSGQVAKDVLAGGGTLTFTGASKVGGDVIFSAGQVTFTGTVEGSIQGNAGTYTQSGSVGGTEDVTINQSVTPPAAGNVVFGQVSHNVVLDAVRHFLVVLLFGALALWILPRGLRSAEELVRRRPLAALGSGIVAVLGYFVALFALLVVMIGLAIAFGLLTLGSLVGIDIAAWLLASLVATFGFVLAVAFWADAVVGLALARVVMPGGTPGRWAELGMLAVGAAVVVIVTTLPVVGPWAKLLVVLFGLGALLLAAWHRWRGTEEVAAAAVPGAMEGPTPGLPA